MENDITLTMLVNPLNLTDFPTSAGLGNVEKVGINENNLENRIE